VLSFIGAPFWRRLPPAGRANSGTYFRLPSGQNFGKEFRQSFHAALRHPERMKRRLMQ
jgi:hypothetical protein